MSGSGFGKDEMQSQRVAEQERVAKLSQGSSGFAATRSEAVASCVPAQERTVVAPHLIELVQGEWGVWRLAGLRGAGFPAAQVLKLASTAYAKAADELIRSEERTRSDAEGVRTALNDALDQLRREGKWDDKKRRRQFLDALHEVNEGRCPEAWADSTGGLLARYREALAFLEVSRALMQQATKDAAQELSTSIYEIASSARFQEAVIWQNHHVWRDAVKPLLELPPSGFDARTSKRRQQEELVAGYFQRYCVKNDTIGFFGPVGWAHFVPGAEGLIVRPGPELVASRTVYFEGWCIDALAATIAKEKSLRRWFAPRCIPLARVDDESVYLPGASSIELQPGWASLLRACDGNSTAKLIASETLAKGTPHFMSEEEIYQALETFCSWGVVHWTLEVPIQRDADKTLRRLLERIEDDRHRQIALSLLDALEVARERIVAAGNPAELERQISSMDEVFTCLTGEAATRSAGQTYAARTLVYQDCRRDIELEVGRNVLNALTPALSLILTSVRWMTQELAQTYRKEFHSIYEAIVEKTGSRTIDATDFWIQCDSILYKDNKQFGDKIMRAFHERWGEVLRFQPHQQRVNFSYEELQPRILAAFGNPRCGWSHARYNSPDIMIAADGPEAVSRGDFELVLGEVHLGVNCLNGSLFVGQHPKPEEVYDALTADFLRPRIVPVPPRNWPKLTARTNLEFVSPRDYQLMVSSDTCGIAPSRALPISALVVEPCEGELVLRKRDGLLRFDLIEGFGAYLSERIMHSFSILPALRHAPRITVDRLAISRECWRFFASEIGFAFEKSEEERYLAARRWKQEFGIPRFVFVKSPLEGKPFYVDFDSPLLVGLLGKMVRNARSSPQESMMTITEMFPAHGQLCLPDSQGNLYTSELRIVILDLSEDLAGRK